MAQKKASQVDEYISNPGKSDHLILLYGPDQGLVSERADKLSVSLGFATSDPMSNIRFEADDIAADPGKLADEAFAISMFGDARLIRIRGTTRKNILPALKPILETPPPDCWIIFEGGDLKRESALRKLIEKSDTAMALACYQDGASALDQLIREEITANNLEMDRETVDYLRSFLGEDRRASRSELKKLALYAHGQKAVTREQISALLGNVSSVANDEIIDAACQGRTNFLELKLDQLFETGGAPDMLIWAMLRQFQMLHKFRASIDKNATNPRSLIASARPPIHFSRHDAVANSLKYWSMKKIEISMARLNKAFFETRSKPNLANSIAATTLLAIALQAKMR